MNGRPEPLSAGFSSLAHGKLILLLTLTTAILGASAALPLLPALRQTMVETLAGDQFARNDPAFAPVDYFDFLREKGAALDGTRSAIGGLGMLGVLLQMFFAGGMVVVLGRGPFSFGQFFEPARRNLWHNVKCFLIFAPSTAVVLGLWLGLAGAARKKMVEDVAPGTGLRSLTLWALVLVALLLFAALWLLYDFARAARRHAPAIGAWRSFRFARRALSGSWSRALGLWLFWLVAGGAAVLALFAITWAMRAASPAGIALLMLLQLAVLGARSAVRVAAWGSYVALLDPRAARALSQTARVRITSSAPAPAAY